MIILTRLVLRLITTGHTSCYYCVNTIYGAVFKGLSFKGACTCKIDILDRFWYISMTLRFMFTLSESEVQFLYILLFYPTQNNFFVVPHSQLRRLWADHSQDLLSPDKLRYQNCISGKTHFETSG